MTLSVSVRVAVLISICIAQKCLDSPPELEFFEDVDDNGINVYRANLTYDAMTFTQYPISFTTRVHNGMLPSPTIRMKQDSIYKITLINNLGPNDPRDPAVRNTFHTPNTTNIHTHGLHVSPQTPSDNVFERIEPNQTHEYMYYIPCNHHGGTNWYHPHHHGASNVQVGAGTAGALIIEDDAERQGLPSWLGEIDELILVIQGLDLNRWVANTAGENGEYDHITQADLSPVEQENIFHLINDEYEPTICLNKGEWKRLRMVHNDVFRELELLMGDSKACDVQLLAKDGVYVSPAPRNITTNVIYFTQSSRVDILIKCDEAGIFDIRTWDQAVNPRERRVNWTIGYLEVSDNNESANIEISQFEPVRPRYLEDLVFYNDSEIDDFWEVEFTAATQINGQEFQGPTSYPEDYEPDINTTNQWNVINAQNFHHPLHIHVNHFQVIEGEEKIGSDPMFTLKGDWLDTIAQTSTIRFLTDTFGGGVVLHCHVLDHEDRGKMAVFNVTGGCNSTDIECIRANSECDDNGSNDKDDVFKFIYRWLFKEGIYSTAIWIGMVLMVLICSLFVYIRCCKTNKKDKKDKLMSSINDKSRVYGSVNSHEQDVYV